MIEMEDIINVSKKKKEKKKFPFYLIFFSLIDFELVRAIKMQN